MFGAGSIEVAWEPIIFSKRKDNTRFRQEGGVILKNLTGGHIQILDHIQNLEIGKLFSKFLRAFERYGHSILQRPFPRYLATFETSRSIF